MKHNAKVRVFLVALFMFGVLLAMTGAVAYTYPPEMQDQLVLERVAQGVDDSISAGELSDLQAIADHKGISLQAAIDRYAWNNTFSLTVDKIRRVFPGDFAAAKIVDAGNAWVAFAEGVPEGAHDIIDTFTSSHSEISVELRTGFGFTEVEVQSAVPAVHHSMTNAPEVLDAYTYFDLASTQIKANVVLAGTASGSVLDDLRAVAVENLTDATRANILQSITVSVIRSDIQVLSGTHSDTEHMGGEILNECTSGFAITDSSGVRGIATAGHCSNSLTDDGSNLTYQAEHIGDYGDFQWHRGPQNHVDEFYGGYASSTEASIRDVDFVGSPDEGQTLCRNGKVSHRDCQEVFHTNACTVGTANDVCNLVVMEGSLSAAGDSGGPVYYGYTAYGFHQGWVRDPNEPFDRDVFSRADRIDDALGVFVTNN